MRLALVLLKKAVPPKEPNPMKDYRTYLSGWRWSQMKKHYSIIPIFGLSILACALAGGYVYRLATKHPEVSWSRRNLEPWNDYKGRQYKFVSSGRDYSSAKGSGSPSSPKTSGSSD